MWTVILAAVTVATLTPSPVFSQTVSQDGAFPVARVAFFSVQRVAMESAVGKTAMAKLDAFRSQTASEIDERNQALQLERQELQQAGSVLSPTARAEIEGRVRKFELDLQRFIEDAQAEFLGIQQAVESDFQLKVVPIVAAVAEESGVHFVFDYPGPGIFWADPRFDITASIIERLDKTTGAND